jgi:predicted acetyltransferase
VADDNITISVPTDADWDAVYTCISGAFGVAPTPEDNEAEHICFEPERSLTAWRDGEVVGTAGIYTRLLAVPGGVIPAGHVTLVSVAASARRRGILTRFMRRQFEDMRAAGEPVAVLWASEGRIYQRFGYGLAAVRLTIDAATREVALLDPAPVDRLREAPPAELRPTLAKVYDEAYQQRPGWSERPQPQWDYRLADLTSWRAGATPLRAVVHHGDDGPDGYALFRVLNKWERTGPEGVVKVLEHVATTPSAYAALWQYLFDIDLTRGAEVFACATDEPLLTMVNEPNRLAATFRDALWARIVDLPAALAARRYATDVDVVLEVTDAGIPANAGRWRLRGSPTSASCEATSDEPDLRCDIRVLGAAYLGREVLYGLGPAGPGSAGLVEELRPGALARAATAFSWYRAPTSIEVF